MSRLAYADGTRSSEANSRVDTSVYPSRSEKSREDVIDEREETAHETAEQTTTEQTPAQETPQQTAPNEEAPLSQRALISGYFHRQVWQMHSMDNFNSRKEITFPV